MARLKYFAHAESQIISMITEVGTFEELVHTFCVLLDDVAEAHVRGDISTMQMAVLMQLLSTEISKKEEGFLSTTFSA